MPNQNFPRADSFAYDEAFSRNIGWVTEWEQIALNGKKVAIAGMGGVGGVHLLTLVRLGIGAFHIADMDTFEVANFNRQVGAATKTVGHPKVEVLAEMARDINPGLSVALFPEGVRDDNIDAFLDGVDLFVDGFDFFVLDMRAKVFARCADLGIPAITAAPIGMGAAYLIFMPGAMTFEEYFRLEGLTEKRKYVKFLMGLTPRALHRNYIMDPTRIDIAGRKGPSSMAAVQLCSGVVGAEALKILLGRGPILAAPHYHQFDAYRNRHVVRKLRWGNRNPLQIVKTRIAYRQFMALSREPWKRDSSPGTEMEKILDLARWAPSGDNSQPWRFEVTGKDTISVHIIGLGDDNVYEYNNGQPTLLTAGFLMETMRIAASGFGRAVNWICSYSAGGDLKLDVTLPKSGDVSPDPLAAYIRMRSVNRRPYRKTPLTDEQKRQLETDLGDGLTLYWYETPEQRRQAARITSLSTDIRLRIPEAYQVHKRILDWKRNFSPWGVPSTAAGVSPMTRLIMKWAMKKWSRSDFMNRFLAGTAIARLELDLIPGVHCAAHFLVARESRPEPAEESLSLIWAGERLQRFWLSATRMGLVMQPSLAALCFAHFGRHGIEFTGDDRVRGKAGKLAGMLQSFCPGEDQENLLFMGRIGKPRSRKIGPRSVRRPLDELWRVEEGARKASRLHE